MPNERLRVRYAPSPTGLQHIGGIRTALFNYLFARSQGGRFVLRVEDTDRQRSESGYLQDLYDSLAWLGIAADEGPHSQGGDFGPYVQSERIALYRQGIQQLLAKGQAYYCFCSPQRLEQLRKQQRQSSVQGYDRCCRSLAAQEAAERAQQESCVVRFALPLEGRTVLRDLLLGDIERANVDINPDPVLLKADGFPTYHLANVIDDHQMQITHVLRAQEWLSSGPLHLLLYRAFGWEPPQFCHLPMVMGSDGSKLSKRHGATSLLEFRRDGYLPQALINYLALLGWAYDDRREFFSLEELEHCFTLDKLSHSPATFDYHKLSWFNGQYIRRQTVSQLKAALAETWAVQLPEVYAPPPAQFERSLDWILPLLQERLQTQNEAPQMAAYFFCQPDYKDPRLAVPKKHSAAGALRLLRLGAQVLAAHRHQDCDWQDYDSLLERKKSWEAAFRLAAAGADCKMGALMQPLRFAITGRTASPPLIESLLILQRLHGSQVLQQRIDVLAKLLAELASTEESGDAGSQ